MIEVFRGLLSLPLVFRVVFREGQEAVRGNYEAKVLPDLASNDAIYCNRALLRKTDNKHTVAANSSNNVRLGWVENSLNINKLDIRTENGPKHFDYSAPRGAVSECWYVKHH